VVPKDPNVDDSSDEWKEFDLSALTYPQFLEYFFDRPVVGDENEYDLFRAGIDSFVASDPATVVRHIQAMCQGLARLVKVYSLEQITQGLWAIFGAGIECHRFVFDPSVDRQLRIECIESMYLPFIDVVARMTGDIREDGSYYWMWWDMIPQSFWAKARRTTRSDNYSDLNDGQRLMADTMSHTLSKILAIGNRNCQLCALHGFGHLHHPQGREIVQRYLDEHRGEFSDEYVKWIEGCRDGRVM